MTNAVNDVVKLAREIFTGWQRIDVKRCQIIITFPTAVSQDQDDIRKEVFLFFLTVTH